MKKKNFAISFSKLLKSDSKSLVEIANKIFNDSDNKTISKNAKKNCFEQNLIEDQDDTINIEEEMLLMLGLFVKKF